MLVKNTKLELDTVAVLLLSNARFRPHDIRCGLNELLRTILYFPLSILYQ
jgi:hypothetical protein